MQVHRDTDSFKASQPVVTIGTFDGVHSGHRYIIDKLKEVSREKNRESVLLTLWPHPREVLNPPGTSVQLLNTLEEKIEILHQQQIDHLVVLEFTPMLSRLDSCEFVRQVLVEQLSIGHLVVGYNHRFGRDRQGDYHKLSECAERYGFTVQKLSAFNRGKAEISSSGIRQLLMEGSVKRAGDILGYHYFLSGTVQGGSRVGREIGFPTANIRLNHDKKLVPSDGVYAVRVYLDQLELSGMLNIGMKPTVNRDPDHKTIEVHIFDFNRDIYQKDIRIEFIDRLRDEMTFSGIRELKEQLQQDSKMAKDLITFVKNR